MDLLQFLMEINMQFKYNDKIYNIYIERKNNKNMYLRVKNDGIYITCNYLTPKSFIINFINDNNDSIKNMIKQNEEKIKKEKEFYFLGNKYDVIVLNTISKIEFYDNKIYVKNLKYLDTFLKNEAKIIFNKRLKICYNLIEENIPYPILLIGKMKRKWGYCNKIKNIIKLNSNLIRYSLSEIDYVIIHELCHLIEFNHSKAFWKYVKKYKPDYKESKKILNY